MEPPQRVQTLMRFADRATKTPEVVAELKKFNMELMTELIKFTGRVLPPEIVTIGKQLYQNVAADWTAQIQNGITTGATISKWAVIHSRQNEQNVRAFVDIMLNDSRKLGVSLFIANYLSAMGERVFCFSFLPNAQSVFLFCLSA